MTLLESESLRLTSNNRFAQLHKHQTSQPVMLKLLKNSILYKKCQTYVAFLQQAKHYGGRNFLHVAVINRCILVTDALLNAGRSINKTYDLCHDKMTGIRVFFN